MIPGRVENWVFIIDTAALGVFDLPIKALSSIIEMM